MKLILGVPRRIRSDNGTENTRVAATHRVFREDDNDSFAGEKSFMFGKSTSNQVCLNFIFLIKTLLQPYCWTLFSC